MKINRAGRFVVLMMVLIIDGCAPQLPSGQESHQPVPYSSLRSWGNESFSQITPIVQEECRRILTLPGDARISGGTPLPSGNFAREWQPACRAFSAAPPTDDWSMQSFFEKWFTPYYVNGDDLIEGFSEIIVPASLHETSNYHIPVYTRPQDLVRTQRGGGSWVSGRWIGTRFVPFYTRAEIDAGALKGKGLEIAWVQSPADLFMLQFQGAGRLRLSDGNILHVAYAARNGRPYTPIGRILRDRNYISDGNITIAAIRDWMNRYPLQARQLMAQNQDYVFFKLLPSQSLSLGSPGAMGIGLTPYRALRANANSIPFGAPVWVETSVKLSNGGSQSWRHMAFMQDANLAAPLGHVALFTGWGPDADHAAADQHETGRLFVLLPRATPE